jgi:SMP-30/Gluconolactonase/LRE-like region
VLRTASCRVSLARGNVWLWHALEWQEPATDCRRAVRAAGCLSERTTGCTGTTLTLEPSVGHIKAFDVRSNGMLANGRVFCELRGERTGIPDGMKVDVEGHVYCTGPGGVWIMDASGKHLGTIVTGVAHTTNIAWGGADWKTLYMTNLASLARIQLKIAGIPVPCKRL